MSSLTQKLPTAYQVALRRDVKLVGAGKYGGVFELTAYNPYSGASRSNRALSQWNPPQGDADADSILDIPTLRDRCRDLDRNNPIAKGLIDTKLNKVVGRGLVVHPRVDGEVLGLSDDESNALERQIQREHDLWWYSREVDAARTLSGPMIERLCYRSWRVGGDVLTSFPRVARTGSTYQIRLQIIESDRLSNPENKVDSPTLAGGIERDEYGAPKIYYISKTHPGAIRRGTSRNRDNWIAIPAFNPAFGLPDIIHLMECHRPGQSRGIPDLSPVIEPLKQLSRLSNAELMASVLSSFFTVFVKTETGEAEMLDFGPGVAEGLTDPAASPSEDTIKMGQGAVVGLAANEDVTFANPTRPNANFEPFFNAIVRQIGAGTGVPYESAIKRFDASYSASRASLLELWNYVFADREVMINQWRLPIYEIWMWEAVASGRIHAPGFLTDPALRRAYLGVEVTGPVMGSLDPLKEILAAEKRIELEVSTRQSETAQISGGDWEQNNKQRRKEESLRVLPPLSASVKSTPDDQSTEDDEALNEPD